MKCEWDGCNQEVDDIKEHLKQHINDKNDTVCRWESCSKKNEPLNKMTLMSHIRMHAGEKLYRCLKCEKEFTKSDALNKHMKRHETGDKMIQSQIDRLFSLSEQRDLECMKTMELLEERQFLINCQRVLHEYMLDDIEEFDSWDNYLK